MTVDDHLIALRRSFSDLKWEDATAILFKKLMKQTVVPLMTNLLDKGRAAMENYIYLLSVLYNMRFKFQKALLLALDRSTSWLRDKADLLGQRSSAAQTLILYTFSMLAHDFNRVFVSMVSSDRESTSRFLGLISQRFHRIVRVIYDFKYYLQPIHVLQLVWVLLSTLTHGRESKMKGVLVVEMREVTMRRVGHKEIRRAKRQGQRQSV